MKMVIRGGRIQPRGVDDVRVAMELAEISLVGKVPHKRLFVIKQSALRRPRSVRELLRAVHRRRLIRARSSATRVHIKNNVLVHYPDRARIVKLFNEKAELMAHVAGSAHGARCFRYLRVPAVHSYGDEPVPHLIEEIISGDNPAPEAINAAREKIAADLMLFHFETLTIRAVTITPRELQLWYDMLKGVGIEVPSIIERYKDTGLACGMLTAKIHGDLSSGNMLQTADATYLIDWEKYGTGPVVRDLRMLSKQFLELSQMYEDRVARLIITGGCDVPSFSTQLAVDKLMRIPDRCYFARMLRPELFQLSIERSVDVIGRADVDEVSIPDDVGPSPPT